MQSWFINVEASRSAQLCSRACQQSHPFTRTAPLVARQGKVRCNRVKRQAVESETKSNKSPADDDNDDIPFEKQMKSRKSKRNKGKKASVQDLQPDPLPPRAKPDSMPMANQIDSSAVLVLASLFIAIIGQGLFLALSGFLPETWDKFATDVIYKTFSPSLGIFLAGSAAYGVWRSKQGSNNNTRRR